MDSLEMTPEQLRARTEHEIEELEREEEMIRQSIEEDQRDPSQQMYFLRMDKKTVIKSQEEYDSCQKHHVNMRTVTYNSAMDHMNKEAATKRKLKARRKQDKIARAQRKRNRRG